MTAPTAPSAPGSLGVVIDPGDLLDYLGALLRWLDSRRAELDRLDEAARASANPQAHTGDVILALTLWQAIRTRTDEIEEVWDSGRADEADREKISQLIWGRLDSGSGAALISLVEAATLCDAVVSQLRGRLAFDPQSSDHVARLRALRAAIVRCEDLADGADERAQAGDLRERLDRLSAQAARGADVTGPLAEIEVSAARTERDLIVAAARRHEAARDRERAAAELAVLESREPALRALAERCRREVVPHPRLAVPAVGRLGDVPTAPDDVTAFLGRLDAVRRAQDTVEEAYAAPLRTRAELRYRLAQAHGRAEANGRRESPTVRSGYDEAHDVVDATPCPLPMAQFLVDQYEFLVREAPQEGAAR